MISKTFRLNVQTVSLFVCDMQERFRPLIHRFPSVLNKVNLLCEVSNLLELPKIFSEQYPQALGNTVAELTPFTQSSNSFIYSKKMFSMLTTDLELEKVKSRNQVLLCGIESHVCISQTAFDLLDSGYQVFIICDAVSSQRFSNYCHYVYLYFMSHYTYILL